MPSYEYDKVKHKNPLAEYNLAKFYFIIYENKILIFEKWGSV